VNVLCEPFGAIPGLSRGFRVLHELLAIDVTLVCHLESTRVKICGHCGCVKVASMFVSVVVILCFPRLWSFNVDGHDSMGMNRLASNLPRRSGDVQ